MPSDLPFNFRAPLLIAGFISLVFGIAGGLLRLGWNISLPIGETAALHGPLMVCGFLGTVISLERAVALRARWSYLAPLSAGLGGIVLIAGLPWMLGVTLITFGSIVLVAASAYLYLQQRVLFLLTLLLGSTCWLLGNLLWLGGFPLIQVIPWWIGFLVLTIAGERLELSRMLPPSVTGRSVFVVIMVLMLIGTVVATMIMPPDMTLLSAMLLALAFWLFQHDIARHTIRQKGLTRFIAICLLSGYVWLLVGGLTGLSSPMLLPGSSYDAFLHAIFVGFVFSMIFGHAPVIFAALARVKVHYHPVFYVDLATLHVSLLARLLGDLLLIPHCRSAGGLLNAVALALFVIIMATAVMRGKRPHPKILFTHD